MPGNPSSATSMLEPLPITAIGTPDAAAASPTAVSAVVVLGVDEERRWAADPERRQRSDREPHVERGPQPCAEESARLRRGQAPSTSSIRASAASATVQMSPHPSVITRSPARTSSVRNAIASSRWGA